MDIFKHFTSIVTSEVEALAGAGRLPAGLPTGYAVEPPREVGHGDLTTNAALVLAKPARLAPRAIAELLAERLRGHADVASADVAGPGFINLRLQDAFWQRQLDAILAAGTAYGDSALGAGEAINVEYVSANPTGPLHVGHVRGAVYGDALANLLQKAGFAVTREYYINDAGAQVDALAHSTFVRYREALGEAVGPIPEGLYPGEYLQPVGAALAARDGRHWLDRPQSEWLEPIRAFAIDAMMAEVRRDLKELGVEHDVFSSERALHADGRVARALAALQAGGHVYTGILEPPKGKKPDDWEPRPQTLFRATAFGDDVDRPLRKSDGSWTYFAADIAYHHDKFTRGFRRMVDVWGADHGGYVKRMRAAVAALTGGAGTLDIKICQLVRVLRAGQPVRMSKRAGEFVTLAELIREVGADAVRFIMLTRKNDAALDFDLAKVLEQSRDNPVFYVQYAHARCCSVRRRSGGAIPSRTDPAMLARLGDSGELSLMRRLALWPRTVEAAAEAHEPHRIAFYLYDLTQEFHAQWNRGNDDPAVRFIVPEDEGLTQARLVLVEAVRMVIASGLAVMGVKPVEEMR
ncbi:MAG: arginine--tRNA ligase [Alphaproteobacteria bacterium]|nr:arginine--tRNA ligase [Alphaproteobacteria bacterium]